MRTAQPAAVMGPFGKSVSSVRGERTEILIPLLQRHRLVFSVIH